MGCEELLQEVIEDVSKADNLRKALISFPETPTAHLCEVAFRAFSVVNTALMASSSRHVQTATETFLKENLSLFATKLLGFLRLPTATLQACALEKVMELTRLACFRPLREKMVTRTVWHLIDNPNYSASLLKLFVSSFLSFDDVQFMTLKGIRKMIRTRMPGVPSQVPIGLKPSELPATSVSLEAFCCNTAALLLQARHIKCPDHFYYGSPEEIEKEEIDGEAAGQKHGRGTKTKPSRMLQPQTYAKEFGHTWREFLLLPLPRDVVKAVLQHMELVILPASLSPLMFAEFLTRCAGQGLREHT